MREAVMKYILMMVLLVLPASAHADWSNAGMHPLTAPNLSPNQGQPLRHQIHVNAPPVRVGPQHSVDPARPLQHYAPPVVNHAQPVHHDQPVNQHQAVARHEPVTRGHFYRNDGFYRSDNDYSPFMTVSPAIALPDGLETIVVDGQTFFYSDGIFYQEVADQLTVIPPVLGAVVDSIPQDYQLVMADGVNYFYAEGVFYQRLEQGFEVVQPPMTDQE